MTKKVFWEDPYLTRLETHITTVQSDDVTVAETIFYAFSGGQESDTGIIGSSPVLQARKIGTEIVYTLENDHRLSAGDAITMSIDWDRRYSLMRLHFAAEIILELVYQTLPGIEKIGAHIAPDKARIDFLWNKNLAALFPSLLERADALVVADHEIISAFSDEESEQRYWEINRFARVPCGGTHLRRTSEVGAIALKRKNVGKGKERVEIYVA